jgi:hypothetical protein
MSAAAVALPEPKVAIGPSYGVPEAALLRQKCVRPSAIGTTTPKLVFGWVPMVDWMNPGPPDTAPLPPHSSAARRQLPRESDDIDQVS